MLLSDPTSILTMYGWTLSPLMIQEQFILNEFAEGDFTYTCPMT